uniref:Uncharacterized protein n=1 Tax=Leersia perrieri TaxID=77586 RepID=A0A0D9W5K6_9ORYZ
MARSPRDRNLSSRRVSSATCEVPPFYQKTKKVSKENGLRLTSEKKDWKRATCSICLERPHKAVLLLCSSHSKGCRPYMCDTNHQHSNCLEQFKNAYLRGTPACDLSGAAVQAKKPKDTNLACPICRGEVKGWTVVKPARRFLNRKRRACMHEGCSFVGSYKRLCKHVKSKHPSSNPREIDAACLSEWKELEYEKERQDAISIITALNPGARIMGDYFIDPNSDSNDSHGYSSDSLTFSDSSDSGSGDLVSTVDDSGIQRNRSTSSQRPVRVIALPDRSARVRC